MCVPCAPSVEARRKLRLKPPTSSHRYSQSVLKELKQIDEARQKEQTVQKRMSVAAGVAPPGGAMPDELVSALQAEGVGAEEA